MRRRTSSCDRIKTYRGRQNASKGNYPAHHSSRIFPTRPRYNRSKCKADYFMPTPAMSIPNPITSEELKYQYERNKELINSAGNLHGEISYRQDRSINQRTEFGKIMNPIPRENKTRSDRIINDLNEFAENPNKGIKTQSDKNINGPNYKIPNVKTRKNISRNLKESEIIKEKKFKKYLKINNLARLNQKIEVCPKKNTPCLNSHIELNSDNCIDFTAKKQIKYSYKLPKDINYTKSRVRPTNCYNRKNGIIDYSDQISSFTDHNNDLSSRINQSSNYSPWFSESASYCQRDSLASDSISNITLRYQDISKNYNPHYNFIKPINNKNERKLLNYTYPSAKTNIPKVSFHRDQVNNFYGSEINSANILSYPYRDINHLQQNISNNEKWNYSNLCKQKYKIERSDIDISDASQYLKNDQIIFDKLENRKYSNRKHIETKNSMNRTHKYHPYHPFAIASSSQSDFLSNPYNSSFNATSSYVYNNRKSQGYFPSREICRPSLPCSFNKDKIYDTEMNNSYCDGQYGYRPQLSNETLNPNIKINSYSNYPKFIRENIPYQPRYYYNSAERMSQSSRKIISNKSLDPLKPMAALNHITNKASMNRFDEIRFDPVFNRMENTNYENLSDQGYIPQPKQKFEKEKVPNKSFINRKNEISHRKEKSEELIGTQVLGTPHINPDSVVNNFYDIDSKSFFNSSKLIDIPKESKVKYFDEKINNTSSVNDSVVYITNNNILISRNNYENRDINRSLAFDEYTGIPPLHRIDKSLPTRESNKFVSHADHKRRIYQPLKYEARSYFTNGSNLNAHTLFPYTVNENFEEYRDKEQQEWLSNHIANERNQIKIVNSQMSKYSTSEFGSIIPGENSHYSNYDKFSFQRSNRSKESGDMIYSSKLNDDQSEMRRDVKWFNSRKKMRFMLKLLRNRQFREYRPPDDENPERIERKHTINSSNRMRASSKDENSCRRPYTMRYCPNVCGFYPLQHNNEINKYYDIRRDDYPTQNQELGSDNFAVPTQDNIIDANWFLNQPNNSLLIYCHYWYQVRTSQMLRDQSISDCYFLGVDAAFMNPYKPEIKNVYLGIIPIVVFTDCDSEASVLVTNFDWIIDNRGRRYRDLFKDCTIKGSNSREPELRVIQKKNTDSMDYLEIPPLASVLKKRKRRRKLLRRR